jgi:hypothetical protein
MATISIVDNIIRVTPGSGETGIIVTIIQKILDIFGNIQDNSISVSDAISTIYDSNELQDGVYLVTLSNYTPLNTIVFITSQIDEQKSLYQIDCIKTKDFVGQKDYRVYYDLIAFCIRYDELFSAIASYQVINTIPFNSPEIITYFNSMLNYFKHDII